MTSDFIWEYPLIYAISTMIYWYTGHLAFRLLLKCEPSNKWMNFGIWVSGSALTTVLILLHSSVPSISLALINFLQYILVAFSYEASLQKRIMSALFILAFVSVVEALVFYSLLFIFHENIASFSENPDYGIIAHIISKLLPLFGFSLYPYFFKTHSGKENMLSTSQALGFFFVPILSISLVLTIHLMNIKEKSYAETLIVLCVAVLLINGVFFLLFDAFSDSMKKHYEHKMLELQVGYYENLYHNVGEERMAIATLRHNIKNDLISLESSLKSGDTVELQRQLTQLLEDKSLENRQNSIIPIVDAVLSYKIPQGEKMGVTLHHEQILTPQLEVSHSHLANILGNLLDNGMEYVSHLPETEQRIVNLQMKKSGQNLTITVSNPFLGEQEFHQDLPLSRKREGKSHGIGLVTVQKLVKELGGYFSVEVVKGLEGQVFTAKVVIYQCFP